MKLINTEFQSANQSSLQFKTDPGKKITLNEMQNKNIYQKSYDTLNNMAKDSARSVNSVQNSILERKKNSNALNLKDVLAKSTELEMFKQFMQSHNAFFDLQCYLDIESYLYLILFIN